MSEEWKKILIKAGIVLVLGVCLHFLFNYMKQRPLTDRSSIAVYQKEQQNKIMFSFTDFLRIGVVEYDTETHRGQLMINWRLDPFNKFYIDFEMEEYQTGVQFWMDKVNELLRTEKLQFEKKGAVSVPW